MVLFRIITRLVLIASFSTATGVRSDFHDGRWWQSTSDDRHSGYLAGFIDCSAYDRGEKHLSEISWQAFQPAISEFYTSHPSVGGKAVWNVFIEAVAKNPPKLSSGGEAYPRKHGIFDGEYWRIMMPDERLGYVEGYSECRTSTKSPLASFTRAPEWYVSQVSAWYQIKEDSINSSKKAVPIATVLFKFKDRSPAAYRKR